MSRPTCLVVEPNALLHNLEQIKRFAPDQQVIAMLKANAYGCGVRVVAPTLDGQVYAFGVACIEEALTIKMIGCTTPCILFQGIFSPDELSVVSAYDFSCVIHQPHQLEWLLNTPLAKPVKVWVKIDTGMHRLGFKPGELAAIVTALKACPWVDKEIGLMSHMACADEPWRDENQRQIDCFEGLDKSGFAHFSMANSAAIMSFPALHYDVVRPGIMLYGVSPFLDKTSAQLGLVPAMRFMSAISAIHHNPPFAQVGYGGRWHSDKPSTIGIVAAGYGDGYPRHIAADTPVWIKGKKVPIVGRVSMDMMAVDLTAHPEAQVGDSVELWGEHVLVEDIARQAGTIGYELLCQISERVRRD